MTDIDTSTERKLEQQFAVAAERFEAGDVNGAQALLEEMLATAPDHPIIMNYLAVTLHLRGDRKRSEALLRNTVKIMPDFFDAWNNLGLVSFEQNNYAAAAEAFEQACQLAPDAADPLINLAHSLHAQNRCYEAVLAYDKGLGMQPDHPSAWTTFSRALLEEGQWEQAATAADRQLALRPGHTVALALKSVALQEQGDTDALQHLVDFDRLIGAFDIDVPDGYDDLDSFNQALADYCQGHRSLKYAPSDKATELGSQTNNLAPEPDTPVTDLLKAIEACAEKYRADRPVSSDHPFLSQRPDNWQIDIWATVLENGGHQQSHIHRVGWLSGVYYAQKPTVIDAENAASDQSGWIEFGSPVFYPKATGEPITRCYPPLEGRLYLFPSYFYHRTIPFFSDTPRISFAFDLRDHPITRQVPFFDYIDG
jgi:tetratricopeptide (TPR) repeat protein